MKVAVVGSGLAGLTTAYLLRQEGVEVWLIEKSDKLGFHSQSVEIPLTPTNEDSQRSEARSGRDEKDQEEKWIVDVPMRGFQGGYYPLLLSLYNHLGIPVEVSNYTFSFSTPKSTYFIHSGSSGYSIPSLPSTSILHFFTLIKDLYLYIGSAICYLITILLGFMAWHDLLPSICNEYELNLKQFNSILSTFLEYPLTIPIINYTPYTPLGKIFNWYISKIILPLFSAVGTMTSLDVWNLPIRIILEYIHATLGTDHYHLSNGFTAENVAELLVDSVKKQGENYLKLSTEIIGLRYDASNVGVKIKMRRNGNGIESIEGGEEIIVDKVVIATQASVAKFLLDGLEDSVRQARLEKEIKRVRDMRTALDSVHYRETIVITHRDTSVLPPRIKDRRDLNFLLPDPSSSSSQLVPNTHQSPHYPVPYFTPTRDKIYTQATQIISPPRHLRRRGRRNSAVLQTTNPCVPIDPRKVISISRLERALPIKLPQKTLPLLQTHYPRSFVFIVGSYSYPGIPLLEGCVGSSKLVVESIIRSVILLKYEHLKYENGKPIDPPPPRKDIGKINWKFGKGNNKLGRFWRWRWCPTGYSAK